MSVEPSELTKQQAFNKRELYFSTIQGLHR